MWTAFAGRGVPIRWATRCGGAGTARPRHVRRTRERATWALWDLNEDRIGTGDPSVLPVGITIALDKENS